MNFKFKLSRRLAGIHAVTLAALLAACAGDRAVTDVTSSRGATDSTSIDSSSVPPTQPTLQPTDTAHAGWFVTPLGASGNDGSAAHPWSLAYALAGAGGQVRPGDTIWVRGGTYGGPLRPSVSGASGAPVVVRAYPGERAIIDANGLSGSTDAFHVTGSWTVYWGLEFTNSNTTRQVSFTGNAGRADFVANYASHVKYINLVLHDGGVAFYNEGPYSDVEMAGCLIYNNGWQGPDRGHGHAIYIRSNTGPFLARDNVLWGQFGYGVHLYSNPGEALLDGVTIQGNVAFNNGAVSSTGPSSNILAGGGAVADNDLVLDNYTYDSPGVHAENVGIGMNDGVRNGTVTVRGNTVVGGDTTIVFGKWNHVTMSGNALLSAAAVLTSQRPGAMQVAVRPNPYEAGRATVVVYNWGGAASVSVDLSGIVAKGSHYVVHDAQDYFGTPAAGGTFGGGTITIPLTARTPVRPVGWSSASPSTGTAFATFIITR